jgi:hypothetical protein
MTGRFDAWLTAKLPEWFTPTVALWVIVGCGFLLLVGAA